MHAAIVHTADTVDPGIITDLLLDWNEGNVAALEQLIPLVEHELHQLAHRHMAREGPGHALQTTALVNEAYIRLIDGSRVSWRNRAHFFAVSARLMRHILVDVARARKKLKRGGDAIWISLDEAPEVADQRSADVIALDDALAALAKIDERKSRVVELRFFGGLSVEETAEALCISPITVMRDWALAKAWLSREMQRSA